MNATAVRRAIAAAIAAGVADDVGLTVTWYVPQSVVAPHAYVLPGRTDFDQAMQHGVERMTFTVQVLVSLGDAETANEALDGFIAGTGATSIKAAIEAARGEDGEPALDGACGDVHVRSADGYTQYEFGTETYLGAQLAVLVIGSGAA